VLGILWTALPALGGIYLLSQLAAAEDFLVARGSAGLMIYVVFFVVAAGFGLLPTYAQAVLGGWVFGFAAGLPAALIGFTGAALVGYVVTRVVSRDRVTQVIEENAKAVAIRDALIDRGFARTLGIITLLRVPPNAPFSLSNLVMAGTGVAIIPYALGTLLGMAPRTAVAAFAAASARTQAKDIQTFVSDGPGLLVFIGGVVAMLVVLAVIGTIANHAIERVVGTTNGEPEEAA
jgi:uncharacterized membrane protein YdjX (TVP38/TMEM64 family)